MMNASKNEARASTAAERQVFWAARVGGIKTPKESSTEEGNRDVVGCLALYGLLHEELVCQNLHFTSEPSARDAPLTGSRARQSSFGVVPLSLISLPWSPRYKTLAGGYKKYKEERLSKE